MFFKLNFLNGSFNLVNHLSFCILLFRRPPSLIIFLPVLHLISIVFVYWIIFHLLSATLIPFCSSVCPPTHSFSLSALHFCLPVCPHIVSVCLHCLSFCQFAHPSFQSVCIAYLFCSVHFSLLLCLPLFCSICKIIFFLLYLLFCPPLVCFAHVQ
jgi:hypothetical protein